MASPFKIPPKIEHKSKSSVIRIEGIKSVRNEETAIISKEKIVNFFPMYLKLIKTGTAFNAKYKTVYGIFTLKNFKNAR